MRVAQFPNAPRVLPQVNPLFTKVLRLQVWALYSLAIQIELPSTAAAP